MSGLGARDASRSTPDICPVSADAGDWREPAEGLRVPFWPSVVADLTAIAGQREQRTASRARGAILLHVAVRSAGFRAVLLYRIAHAVRTRAGLVGRAAAAFLFWCGRHWYGCSIASTARLHGGLVLPHPQGIVIGGGVVIGPRAWVFQNVTVGGAPDRDGMPWIGADVRLYAGAVVSGPVRIGDSVVVGANAVVGRDVPARTTVRLPEMRLASSARPGTMEAP